MNVAATLRRSDWLMMVHGNISRGDWLMMVHRIISHRDLLAMVCGNISQQRLHCISAQFRSVKGRGGKLAE